MSGTSVFPLVSVSHLESPASRSAITIDSLIEGIAIVDERVLFHHVARIPLRFENARDLPANDFSRWVRTSLQDPETAEHLAFAGSPSLAPLQELRRALLHTLQRVPARRRRQEAPEEAAFHFLRATSITAPLDVVLREPHDLTVHWAGIDRACLFYHLIEAPLLGPESASLAPWLRECGAVGLARTAEDLAATGRPLGALQRELGSRWRRRLLPNRLVRRLEAPEEIRQAEAHEAILRFAGRLRGNPVNAPADPLPVERDETEP